MDINSQPWTELYDDLIFLQPGGMVLKRFTLPPLPIATTFRARTDLVGFASGRLRVRFGMEDADVDRSNIGIDWRLVTSGRRYRSQAFRNGFVTLPPATKGNWLLMLPPRASLATVVFSGQATARIVVEYCTISVS